MLKKLRFSVVDCFIKILLLTHEVFVRLLMDMQLLMHYVLHSREMKQYAYMDVKEVIID